MYNNEKKIQRKCGNQEIVFQNSKTIYCLGIRKVFEFKNIESLELVER